MFPWQGSVGPPSQAMSKTHQVLSQHRPVNSHSPLRGRHCSVAQNPILASVLGSLLLLLVCPRGFPLELLRSCCLFLSSPFTLALLFSLPSLILSQRGHKPLIKGFYLLFSHLQGFGATMHYPTSHIHYLFPGSTQVKLK